MLVAAHPSSRGLAAAEVGELIGRIMYLSASSSVHHPPSTEGGFHIFAFSNWPSVSLSKLNIWRFLGLFLM